MARQPLYSCLSCARETTKRRRISSSASQSQTGDLDAQWLAGVCLACSIKCHDGHELVELYTKRYSALSIRQVYSHYMILIVHNLYQ